MIRPFAVIRRVGSLILSRPHRPAPTLLAIDEARTPLEELLLTGEFSIGSIPLREGARARQAVRH